MAQINISQLFLLNFGSIVEEINFASCRVSGQSRKGVAYIEGDQLEENVAYLPLYHSDLGGS